MRMPIALTIVLWALIFGVRLAAESPPLPSATVHIPMRDGAELTADLYYPDSTLITNEYPCIVVRLPGGRKAESWLPLANLAKAGYVVAIQDTRSALDPERKTFPYMSDSCDGYDTVNWLANSSFTNGMIGSIGFSAAGVTQLMMAPMAPPALKCQYVGQAAGSVYHHIYPGGRFQKSQVETWLAYHGFHESVTDVILGQPLYNDFWSVVDAVSLAHQVQVPAVHYCGWYDPFIQGTIDEFVARQNCGGEGAKGCQKLLIGPWNHFWPIDLSFGEYQVPENARQSPIDISSQRWFDHYLKGADNGVEAVATVTYYVMGPADGSPSSGNVWRHADAWPVPSVATPLYLSSEKKLTWVPANTSAAFSMISDPANPVPKIGGRVLFLPSGPRDQVPVEGRSDVLVFTSAPLEEDMEVTGQVLVHLLFGSDQPDTDVAVRLTDVYPDGKSLLVAEGIARTGLMHTRALASGTPKEVVVDLWSTSMVFAKGHAIRISIAGSNYPHYELSGQLANSKVYVGGSALSRLVLPVVRKGEQWLVSKGPQ